VAQRLQSEHRGTPDFHVHQGGETNGAAMNAIKLHKIERWLLEKNLRWASKLVYYLIFLLYNSSIPAEAEIGEGTQFAYAGIGVVLHADSRIGCNVLIGQHVTVGGRAPLKGVPVIEDACFLGPGAVILGPIRVGKGSIVGANAVVLHDVPPRSVVAGVPARVIRSNIRTRDYYNVWNPADPPAADVVSIGSAPARPARKETTAP
jgi:serine O-acetyltransferase